jgi:tape measure domain-containing protein
MIVRELITRLGYAVNDTQLRRYQAATNNIRNMADGAAESFRNIFLAFAGFSAIQSIARVADEMQSLEARVGMLPQTVTSAADAFDVVAQRATAARQSLNAYGGFYVKLQQAGKDFIKTQEDGLKVTDTISKALIVGGATAAEQSSALLQFGQAIGSGVLQGEELRALSEAAPQFLDGLAEAIGVPRAELKKFASEGKLTSKAVIEAVLKMSSAFDDKFRKMPITIGQATTIIGNRWAVFINRLNRESSAVTNIANFFLDGFDAIEAGLAKMVTFFGGATETLKFFGIVLAAALAPMLIRNAAGAIAFFLTPAGLMFGALIALGLALEDFYNWMNGGKSIFGRWFGNFDEAMKKLEQYSGWITAVKIAVASAVGVMVANWLWAASVATIAAGRAAIAWVTSMAQFAVALAANAVAVGTWVATLLTSLGTMAAGWIASFVSMTIAAAPVILTIAAIVAAVAGIIAVIYFFLDNWKLVFSLLKNIATLNFSGIADDFSAMVDKLKGYWNSFKSFFGMGVSTTVGANVTKPNAVSPATVAGAASSPNGVPVTNTNNAPMTFTVNQTLPPGTPQETADAAKGAIEKAFQTMPMDRLQRQIGQVGG